MWRVAYKELLSTWRDKRTLRSTILMPLVFIPLFTVMFPFMMSRAFTGQQEERQKVGVVRLQSVPKELRDLLTRDTRAPDGRVVTAGVELVDVQDARQAVTDKRVDAALEFPEPLPAAAGEGTSTVRLYSKVSDQRVQAGASAKVQAALRAYNDLLVARKLQALDLDPTVLTPVSVQQVDTSTTQERSSGFLAFLIPYFLLQFIASGAMSPAIDSTAGEKERGTLEVLLVSPVRRIEVVVGKLLATTIFAVSTAVFGVIGFALAGPLAKLVLPTAADGQGVDVASVFGGTLSVGVADFVILLVTAISSALLLSSLLMSIAVYARSFREAQTYLTPIFIILILPMFVLQFSDFIDKSAALYATPIVGAALVILDLVKGAFSAQHALLAVLSNLVCTVLLTLLANRSFNREQIIFRN